jgi:hypothetical protein
LEKHVMQIFLFQRVMVALCVSLVLITFSLHETKLVYVFVLSLICFTVNFMYPREMLRSLSHY